MIEIILGPSASRDVVAAEREVLALRGFLPIVGVAGIRRVGDQLVGFVCAVGEPLPSDTIRFAVGNSERAMRDVYPAFATSAAIVGYPRGS